MINRLKLFILPVATCALVMGCSRPSTFIRTYEPGWATIELRNDVVYDKAWEDVVDLLIRHFDMEILSRDDGYARSGWLYSWTGELTEGYKVRSTVKFTPDKRSVQLKSEAQYYRPFAGEWIQGTDSLLLSTLKSDIMGVVGRTTR